MNRALAQRPEQSLVHKDQLTPQDLVAQVRTIQEVMKAVMKSGEHYGVIPGTGDKPSLLKPGAEKLCLLFRLAPEYEVMPESSASDSFIRYVVRCNLKHIPTGMFAGSGIGACNSREAKYRWRSTNTGQPVPKEYWDSRDPAVLGGPQFKPRKVSKEGQPAQWVVYEQIEHDNPWDYDNTLVKMAEKRALVAALLNATAASDIFTQDLEDLQANGVLDVTPAKPATAATTPAAGPASQAGKGADPSPASPGGGASSPAGGGVPSQAGGGAPSQAGGGHPLRWWPECVNQQGVYRAVFDRVQLAAENLGRTKEDVQKYALGTFVTKTGKKVTKMMYLSAANVDDLLADLNEGNVPGAAGGTDTYEDIPFAPEA